MNWKLQAAGCVLWCCLSFSIGGCGSSGPVSGRVQGMVLLKGQPLSAGQVSFYAPASGHAAITEVMSDGKFTLRDPLPTGIYRVSLMPPAPPETGDPTAKAPVSDIAIPTKYQTESTTPFEVTVESGENDFPLTIE